MLQPCLFVSFAHMRAKMAQGTNKLKLHRKLVREVFEDCRPISRCFDHNIEKNRLVPAIQGGFLLSLSYNENNMDLLEVALALDCSARNEVAYRVSLKLGDDEFDQKLVQAKTGINFHRGDYFQHDDPLARTLAPFTITLDSSIRVGSFADEIGTGFVYLGISADSLEEIIQRLLDSLLFRKRKPDQKSTACFLSHFILQKLLAAAGRLLAIFQKYRSLKLDLANPAHVKYIDEKALFVWMKVISRLGSILGNCFGVDGSALLCLKDGDAEKSRQIDRLKRLFDLSSRFARIERDQRETIADCLLEFSTVGDLDSPVLHDIWKQLIAACLRGKEGEAVDRLCQCMATSTPRCTNSYPRHIYPYRKPINMKPMIGKIFYSSTTKQCPLQTLDFPGITSQGESKETRNSRGTTFQFFPSKNLLTVVDCAAGTTKSYAVKKPSSEECEMEATDSHLFFFLKGASVYEAISLQQLLTAESLEVDLRYRLPDGCHDIWEYSRFDDFLLNIPFMKSSLQLFRFSGKKLELEASACIPVTSRSGLQRQGVIKCFRLYRQRALVISQLNPYSTKFTLRLMKCGPQVMEAINTFEVVDSLYCQAHCTAKMAAILIDSSVLSYKVFRVKKDRLQKVHQSRVHNSYLQAAKNTNNWIEWNKPTDSMLLWKTEQREKPDTPYAACLFVVLFVLKADL